MVFSASLNLSPDHFSLSNQWVHFNDYPPNAYKINDFFSSNGKHTFVIDDATKDRYLDEELDVIRIKCGLIFLASIFIHPIAATINLAGIASQIFLLNCNELTHNILRIVSTPFVFVGMLFACLYGLTISPLDGRKLYASLERFYYHSSVIADCFQPSKSAEFGYQRVELGRCLVRHW